MKLTDLLPISRLLPGELEGEIDPEDLGFDTIRDDPPDDAEAAVRVAQLYAQTKKRTGVAIPELEPYLKFADTAQSGETAGSGHPSAGGQKPVE